MPDRWPDWCLEIGEGNDDGARRSMRELARYTDPGQTVRQGLGLGHTRLNPTESKLDQATRLAEKVLAQRIGYTREPFAPERDGQIIRTTQELLDGAGTCVDFAVTLAALLNRERIPAVLVVARADGKEEAHAFVLAWDDGGDDDERRNVPITATFAHWANVLTDPLGPYRLLDITPPYDGDDLDLAGRNAATVEYLQGKGVVHALDIRSMLLDGGIDFHLPPIAHRHLGITAYLPDPALDLLDFPSRSAARSKLAAATGRVLLVGESGTGKSTLALERAMEVSDHRGWFLDGSDPDMLRRSLAAAEAQSRGEPLGPLVGDEGANLRTRVARAHERLARSERPWVVVVDNANSLDAILALLPVPRAASGDRAADLLIVTSTDDDRRGPGLATAGWNVVPLERLTDEDASAVGAAWTLLDETERLPGLLRIATWCAGQLVAADEPEDGERGPDRIVRAAIDQAGTHGAVGAAMVAAVRSAAFMPAEQVTVEWVARAGFGGEVADTLAAVRLALTTGLVECSRADVDAQLGNHPPLWMHRLVRSAVQRGAARETGLRVLATYVPSDGLRYSADETMELHDLVRRRNGPWKSADELRAAATICDLLELQGSKGVTAAGRLAEEYVGLVDDVLRDAQPLQRISVFVRAQLAVTRRFSHGGADTQQLEDGMTRCRKAARSCAALIDDTTAAPADRDAARLLRGRAEAMHGILLRKLASAIPAGTDDVRREELYRESIEVLTNSHEERLGVFRKPDGSLKPDPDRHVDRGWYNLGGTHISLANMLHSVDPTDAGRAAVAETLSDAAAAYAGSLTLRRPDITNYTAASLWGVALTMYSAALYCPGDLDLSIVAPVEELNGVRNVQNRASLLRAAEDCVTQALRIWTELGGYPENARKLLRKICLAWVATSQDPAQRADQIVEAVREALDELGVAELHVVRRKAAGG